jgi:hypothetical protein
MRARACWVAVLLALPVAAVAEPKPEAVDIKSYRDKLVVLQDARGGTYVVMTPHEGENHAFYGTGKTLYEQVIGGRGQNGDAWNIDLWAPRVPRFQNSSLVYKQDKTFALFCGSDETGLTQLTGDKAKAVLDKSAFLSPALVWRARVLARDDAGVYYYVDGLREKYGGKGFRLFVGKKGGMKQVPITDIASDTGGEVFSTKSGDLRLVTTANDSSSSKTAVWIKGEKRTTLVVLDVDSNSPVIYGELGVYSFIGTVCESL